MSSGGCRKRSMYKSFEMINDFVKDIYGLSIIQEPMPTAFRKIRELENSHNAIMSIIKDKRKPFSDEFVKYIYPLLEVSIQWEMLKNKGNLTGEFIEKCKRRAKTQTNYYGTIFEIDTATRCFLSDWQPAEYREDYTKPEKQIDFIFKRNEALVGVECLSKRYTENNLTIKKLNKDIHDKAKKFKQEYISKLGVQLDERVLLIDITTSTYSPPILLSQLSKTQKSNNLDGVVYTWREDRCDGENHSLVAGYAACGYVGKIHFLTTFAGEFRVHNGNPVFFARLCGPPEPLWGTWGPEQT
jgi:hypothetical protein